MVSLWPWKGDDTASFEKTLSSLSEKIKRRSITRDALRTSSRRYKVLWTLYATIIYIICALIFVLVTGWHNWATLEYGAVLGGPIVIYLVRTALAAYYNYRLSNNQAQLNVLVQQRDSAIEKFKKATKYNTTQQLLEKYGAAPPGSSSAQPSPISATKGRAGSSSGTPRQRQARTGIAPPPTANIRRPEMQEPLPHTLRQAFPPPSGSATRLQSIVPSAFPQSGKQELDPSADFAPNAFSAPPQYSTNSSGPQQSKWYDRMLDVLLGDDETRAANRLALICTHCRLVNGQAPPGVKRLEDVGKWKCSACGGWNGDETEASRIIEAVGKGRDSSGYQTKGQDLQGGLRKRTSEMTQKNKVDGAVDGTSDAETDDVSHYDGELRDGTLLLSTGEDEKVTHVSTRASESRVDSDSAAEDESSLAAADISADEEHTPPARSTRSRTNGARKPR